MSGCDCRNKCAFSFRPKHCQCRSGRTNSLWLHCCLCQGGYVLCSVCQIQKKKLCCLSLLTLWNTLPLTMCDPSLTLTQFCALKTVLSAELMKYNHSASVIV